MMSYPGITARFRLDRPETALATLTVSMTVKQWVAIAEALSKDHYEQWPLRAAILDLVRHAEKEFYYRDPENDGA